ncbi:MAG: Fic family protein [Gimesia sp.]
MTKNGRYDTSGSMQNQYEPGSTGAVLKNLLGIKSVKEMEQVETLELERVTNEAIDLYDRDYRFAVSDIYKLHRRWLGTIYDWAGRERVVMVSKGGFPFAAPAHISNLMNAFEKQELVRFTPCHRVSHEKIAEALATVHVELMLIHPFREGNGRLGRLLAVLMALQADLPPLDFTVIDEERKYDYIKGVQAGIERNYQPMTQVFNEVITRTLELYEV